ncbi:hypothetical protein CRG98_008963 [Punica granatum]|uniref:Uncharacterized protein n=1 Tax=Punica granatum TaxID=22663 RepID=A0A2I0KQY4_PUNGR|nr:hypothetical protein CRG98_008963 [Punica granatum]
MATEEGKMVRQRTILPFSICHLLALLTLNGCFLSHRLTFPPLRPRLGIVLCPQARTALTVLALSNFLSLLAFGPLSLFLVALPSSASPDSDRTILTCSCSSGREPVTPAPIEPEPDLPLHTPTSSPAHANGILTLKHSVPRLSSSGSSRSSRLPSPHSPSARILSNESLSSPPNSKGSLSLLWIFSTPPAHSQTLGSPAWFFGLIPVLTPSLTSLSFSSDSLERIPQLAPELEGIPELTLDFLISPRSLKNTRFPGSVLRAHLGPHAFPHLTLPQLPHSLGRTCSQLTDSPKENPQSNGGICSRHTAQQPRSRVQQFGPVWQQPSPVIQLGPAATRPLVH